MSLRRLRLQRSRNLPDSIVTVSYGKITIEVVDGHLILHSQR